MSTSILTAGLAFLAIGCATSTPATTPGVRIDDLDAISAELQSDLARASTRSVPTRKTAANASLGSQALPTRDAVLSSIVIPVANLRPRDLYDSWGAPRDGGKRKHRGIDIFAPRGTEILAVADGIVSYIGEQPLGGRCVWLATEQGVSFYYAHLDRWAPGLYEGMPVRQGTVLGYVGNTGNAISTPPHLHFSVVEGDESINPYPLLKGAGQIRPRPVLAGGFTAGGSQ
ncbi:MAG: M23 family metallopeptidase [Thermoanaerobaculia bacterium]